MNKLYPFLTILLILYFPNIYPQKYLTCLDDTKIDKINEIVILDFISKDTQLDTLFFNIIPVKWDYVIGQPHSCINRNYNNVTTKNEFEIDSLLNQYFCGYKYILKNKINYQNKLNLLSQVINLNESNFTWNYPDSIPITDNILKFRSLSLTQPYCIDDKYVLIGFYLYNGYRFEQAGIVILINNNEWTIYTKIGCWRS